MSFDALTREHAKKQLSEDFVQIIRASHSDGLSFGQFAALYSNKTIANIGLMAEVLSELVPQGEIIVTGPKGNQKRTDKIQANDIIRPCNQRLLFSLKDGT